MKTRLGFVSNSSSSSFVLFGVKVGKVLDRTLEITLMEAFGYKWKRKVAELDDDAEEDLEELDDKDIEDDVFDDFLSTYLEAKGLVVVSGEDDGVPNAVYVGRRIDIDECAETKDDILKLDDVNKIVADINRRLKTKHKGEVVIGTRCC